VTGRDRTAVIAVGAVVLLAAFWFLMLAPKRSDAGSLADKIAQAQQRLDTARETSIAASRARDRYDEDYAAVAKLGKAIPADDDVASMVYQLDHVSKGAHIDFRSITLDSTGAPAAVAPPPAQAAAVSQASGSSAPASSAGSATPAPPASGVPASQSAAAGLPPGSTVGSAGFPTMPFSFVFDGSFFAMEDFFRGVQGFAAFKDGGLSVHGRLLTIDSFALTASTQGFPKIKASIKATAYLVPQSEGLAAGATPQGPAAAAPPATASPAAPATATSITGGAR
jgi:Tfp pilus assembly protein PilO